ncbi:MAG: CHAT domain-containing protein, partial [Acidobacteria bacterium]|nr:CHAT domain-containing protein [Acidobacteriota bacterium]
MTLERELNEALAQYKVELEELSKSRGMDFRAVTRIPFSSDDDSYLLRGVQPINYERNLSSRQISGALDNYPAQTAVLFYSYKGDALRIWLIDSRGIQASHEANVSRASLASAISNLRASLGVEALQLKRTPRLLLLQEEAAPKVSKQPLQRSINELTKILLPAQVAQKLISVKHLIVAPVLGIGSVPFAVLRPFGETTYLIDKMSISVAPSIYDVVREVRAWEPDFRKALVVGNPYFAPSPKWKVPPLPGAEEEALYVAKNFHAQPLLGKQAMKQEIVAAAKNADVL